MIQGVPRHLRLYKVCTTVENKTKSLNIHMSTNQPWMCVEVVKCGLPWEAFTNCNNSVEYFMWGIKILTFINVSSVRYVNFPADILTGLWARTIISMRLCLTESLASIQSHWYAALEISWLCICTSFPLKQYIVSWNNIAAKNRLWLTNFGLAIDICESKFKQQLTIWKYFSN